MLNHLIIHFLTKFSFQHFLFKLNKKKIIINIRIIFKGILVYFIFLKIKVRGIEKCYFFGIFQVYFFEYI